VTQKEAASTAPDTPAPPAGVAGKLAVSVLSSRRPTLEATDSTRRAARTPQAGIGLTSRDRGHPKAATRRTRSPLRGSPGLTPGSSHVPEPSPARGTSGTTDTTSSHLIRKHPPMLRVGPCPRPTGAPDHSPHLLAVTVWTWSRRATGRTGCATSGPRRRRRTRKQCGREKSRAPPIRALSRSGAVDRTGGQRVTGAVGGGWSPYPARRTGVGYRRTGHQRSRVVPGAAQPPGASTGRQPRRYRWTVRKGGRPTREEKRVRSDVTHSSTRGRRRRATMAANRGGGLVGQRGRSGWVFGDDSRAPGVAPEDRQSVAAPGPVVTVESRLVMVNRLGQGSVGYWPRRRPWSGATPRSRLLLAWSKPRGTGGRLSVAGRGGVGGAALADGTADALGDEGELLHGLR